MREPVPAPSTRAEHPSLPDVVDEATWYRELERLLVTEKELTRARDALAARRRRMPMTAVRGDYRFVRPDGETTLLGLFDGRRQLITYRFFYAPDVENWPDAACEGCSMFADNLAHPAHLAARDTSLALVTAAPQELVQSYQRRMGWNLPFATTIDGFSDDFGVSEYFGINVFLRDGDDVFRTYFLNWRGIENVGTVWSLLDLTPFGRQERWEDSPAGRPQGEPYTWWRLHDEYAG
ncbi:DUF899 family protein [Kineococcus sp. SYSU DK003]|uniref:DUF899 family protein n=1 Tax=Kineococcus sp. SYSU DK003 TaxID=3383124 RepID=UPI003D7E6CBC